jgi:hypothetical protein
VIIEIFKGLLPSQALVQDPHWLPTQADSPVSSSSADPSSGCLIDLFGIVINN